MRVPAVAWAGGVVAIHLQRGADAFVVRPSGTSLISWVENQKECANDVFFMCRKPGDSAATQRAPRARSRRSLGQGCTAWGCSKRIPTVFRYLLTSS